MLDKRSFQSPPRLDGPNILLAVSLIAAPPAAALLGGCNNATVRSTAETTYGKGGLDTKSLALGDGSFADRDLTIVNPSLHGRIPAVFARARDNGLIDDYMQDRLLSQSDGARIMVATCLDSVDKQPELLAQRRGEVLRTIDVLRDRRVISAEEYTVLQTTANTALSRFFDFADPAKPQPRELMADLVNMEVFTRQGGFPASLLDLNNAEVRAAHRKNWGDPSNTTFGEKRVLAAQYGNILKHVLESNRDALLNAGSNVDRMSEVDREQLKAMYSAGVVRLASRDFAGR